MLQKASYETMGPILLSQSQEDSSKIKKSGDLLRYCSRTEVIEKTAKEKIVTIV